MLSNKTQKFLLALTQRNDLMIAIILVMIVFMMIIPLPTELVDVLIAFNIGVAIILLMVAVYLTTPLEFVAFPAVLLLTTLFRLSLSITTTRLILLQGDAGAIIQAFGSFAVGGNLVVGLVVFLIITIVQFLVITKGSERVAEVSARFSLDGMPGKQMSIDSDMRAGLIDMHEARERRQKIEKESQLFGSMDGAMKFVKGDAIAGIIITIVNIIGGISIGVFQQGLSSGEAASIYAILTIGDGLIAQIPALIISVTAGIIVTRVTTESSEDLGSDITTQVKEKPPAIMVGGAVLLLFSPIPGFPTMTFLLLGSSLFIWGFFLNRKKKSLTDDAVDLTPLTADNDAPGAARTAVSRKQDEFNITVPIILELHETAEAYFNMRQLNNDMIDLRRAMYLDLGVPFPGIHVRFTDAISKDHYRILLNETPAAEVEFIPDNLFLKGYDIAELEELEIPFEQKKEILPGVPSIWIPDDLEDTLEELGVNYMTLPRLVTFHLSYVLRKYCDTFIGLQETRYLLEKMDERYSELVKEVQRLLPLQKIAEIFQRLVSEDISIRDLRSILESLIEWSQKEKDTVLLTEYVRTTLKRYISYKFGNGQNILPCYLLDNDLEETIRSSIRQTSAGSYLSLDPNVTNRFVDRVREIVGGLVNKPYKPVMLTSMDIRRYVKKLIEIEFYDIPVISHQELTQDIVVQPIDRIILD